MDMLSKMKAIRLEKMNIKMGDTYTSIITNGQNGAVMHTMTTLKYNGLYLEQYGTTNGCINLTTPDYQMPMCQTYRPYIFKLHPTLDKMIFENKVSLPNWHIVSGTITIYAR